MANLPVSKTGHGGSNPSAPARFRVWGLPLASGEPLDWIESEMAEDVSIRKNDSGGALEQAKGFWQRFQQYAYEVKTETKRVSWPGKQEIYGTTVMVILTTFLFGIYFWFCDQLFQYTVSHTLKYFMHRG